jgi:hypothetical protein
LVVKNGLEDAGLGGRVHPAAGVGHGEPDVGAGPHAVVFARVSLVDLDVGRFDDQPAPWGMASRALTARLRKTCSICPGSARTRAAEALVGSAMSMSSPMSRRRTGVFSREARS